MIRLKHTFILEDKCQIRFRFYLKHIVEPRVIEVVTEGGDHEKDNVEVLKFGSDASADEKEEHHLSHRERMQKVVERIPAVAFVDTEKEGSQFFSLQF